MTAVTAWIAAYPWTAGALASIAFGCMILALHLALWRRYHFPAVLVSMIACAAIGLAVWIEDVNWSALVILAGGAVIWWLCCQWKRTLGAGSRCSGQWTAWRQPSFWISDSWATGAKARTETTP